MKTLLPLFFETLLAFFGFKPSKLQPAVVLLPDGRQRPMRMNAAVNNGRPLVKGLFAKNITNVICKVQTKVYALCTGISTTINNLQNHDNDAANSATSISFIQLSGSYFEGNVSSCHSERSEASYFTLLNKPSRFMKTFLGKSKGSSIFLILMFAAIIGNAQNVTQASGGTNISADKAANATGPGFTLLGPITLAETAKKSFQNGSFTITAPTGWTFNSSGVTVTGETGAVAYTSSTVLTISISSLGNGSQQTFNIEGISVKANDGANIPNSGNLTFTNVSLNQDNPITDGTNLGSLSQAVGALNKFVITLPGQTFTDASTLAASGNTGTVTAQTAGTSFNIGVRATDQFFNIVTTYTGVGNTANITASGSTLTSGSGTTATFSSGVLSSHSVALSPSGSNVTLTATRTSGGGQAGTSSPFVLLGPATKLAFGTQPTNTVAATSISPAVTVQVQDANSNLVTTDNTTQVTLAIGTNPGSGTLSGTKTVTVSGGVATFSNLSINKTGTGYTLAATSSPVFTGATSNAFNITPGAVSASQSTISASPSSLTADGSSASTITVTAKDANGNVIPSITAANVVLASTGTGNTLTPPSTATDAGGQTTGTLKSTKAEAKTVSVTISGTAITATAIITFTPGVATKLVFVTQPSNTVAGATMSNVTVQVQDVNSNLVTTDTRNITLSIGTNPGGGTLSGTLTVAASSGIATFSTLSINKSGTGYTLGATSSPALTVATSNTFNITPGTATQLAFAQQPTNRAAAASITPAVTVQLLDANGNITTSTASVTIAIGTNPGGGTLSGTATVAAVSGVATFSTLSINKTGVGYTLTAASGVLTGATSNTFNITPGAATKLVVGTQPSNTVAGATMSNVTVQVQDANSNLVTTDTRNITLAIGTNPGGGTLSGTLTVAASGGIATFSTLSINKSGTGYTLGATSSPALTVATSSTFNITPGAATKLVFGTQPSNTVAATSISPAVTVQVQDANSNIVTTDNTTQVILAIGTNPGSGTLSGTTTVAVSGGIGTFSTLSINKSGTGYTLGATSSPVLTGATSNTFNITPGALDHFAISTISSPQVAGTAITGITLTAQDINNNTQTGYVSTVAYTGTAGIAGTSANFTAGVLTGVSVTPTVAGSNLTFIVTGATKTGTATFDVNPPAPTLTSFTPSPGFTGSSVVITGTDFTGATAVTFGGTAAASYTVNSATQITAIVGAGTTGNVAVTTFGGTATSAGTFTYNVGYGSTQDGNWNVGSTWVGGVVPATNTAVTIGHNVTLTDDRTVSDLTLNAGTIIIGTNTFTINGTVSRTSGNLVGGNTSNLVIGGAANSIFFDQTAATTNNYLKNFTLNTGATATLGNALNITGGTTSNTEGTLTVTGTGVLTTGGFLTINSNQFGTARIAANTNGGTYISGNVTVERYIPANANRAWRLLAVPASGQTIKEAWQDGQTNSGNTVSNTNSGFGTQITSNITGTQGGAQTLGFDDYTPGASMLKYIPSTNLLTGVPNTNDATTGKIALEQGYFLYIRGDRSKSKSSATNDLSATTLRTSGTLNLGTKTTTIAANESALLGNPYASAINLLTGINYTGTVGATTFRVWDPKLNTVGGYQTLAKPGSVYVVTPGGGSYGSSGSPVDTIESGQAFFISGGTSGGDINITENSKTSGSKQVFKPSGADNYPALFTNIYSVASTGNRMVDGNFVAMDDSYNNLVDDYDGRKQSNFNENFGMLRDGVKLVVEKRQPFTATDTVFYNMNQMRANKYLLELRSQNIDPSLVGVLEDSYLNSRTPVLMNGTATYNFTVDANTGSFAANRFRLVFGPLGGPLPVTFTNVKAAEQAGNIAVRWTVGSQLNLAGYEVEKSTNGRNFSKVATQAVAANTDATYNWLDVSAAQGANFYRIKAIDLSGAVKYSNIVKVVLGKKGSGITVSPNPIKGNTINVQFANQPAGNYTIRLINTTGQVMYSSVEAHAGGSATQSFILNSKIASGVYQLEVIAPNKTRQAQKLIIDAGN